MIRGWILAVAATCCCVLAALMAAGPARGIEVRKRDGRALPAERRTGEPAADHTEWIVRSLREMQTVKPGMTRADLLKVFQEEGGLSTPRQRRYVYRECPYIKVEVTFNAGREEALRDTIRTISRPFLEWSIED